VAVISTHIALLAFIIQWYFYLPLCFVSQVPPVQNLYLLGKPSIDPVTGKKKNRALGFEDFFDLSRLKTHQVSHKKKSYMKSSEIDNSRILSG